MNPVDLDWRDGWCHVDGHRVGQVFRFQHCGDSGPGWAVTINYQRLDGCWPSELDAMAALEGILFAEIDAWGQRDRTETR